MASVYDLKPAFQKMLRPACHVLARTGVTANQVTVAAAVLSIATGLALALYPSPALWLLVPVALFLRMALNAIDGMLAREFGMKSDLGAILNELGDVIGDAALYLPFALVPGCRPALVVIVVLLAVLSEMTGVLGVQIGASRRYDGPMGKSDRAVVFGALALALAFRTPIGWWIDLLIVAVILLLLATIANRVRRALAERRSS